MEMDDKILETAHLQRDGLVEEDGVLLAHAALVRELVGLGQQLAVALL
jgi:hypothetical protein